jgi:hypothetical protein
VIERQVAKQEKAERNNNLFPVHLHLIFHSEFKADGLSNVFNTLIKPPLPTRTVNSEITFQQQ